MSEQNMKIEKSPSVSIGRLIKDNWYLIKTVFSASPFAVSLYAFEQFRVQVLVFFEHTWLIQTVLECIEYKRSFYDAMIPILLIFLIITVTSVLGGIMMQWLLPKAKLKAQTKFKNMVFAKARQVDLKQFDDPKYYNDFVMTASKTGELIDRTFSIMNQHNSRLMTELCKPDILVQMPFDSYGDMSDYALAGEIIEKGRELMSAALDNYEEKHRKRWWMF